MDVSDLVNPIKLPKNFHKNIVQEVAGRITKNFPEEYARYVADDGNNTSSSEIANRYLEVIEKEIAKIAKQFNHFGLLVALHHVYPPIPLLPAHKHFIPDSQAGFNLAILSAMKYCSPAGRAKYVLTAEEYLSDSNIAKKFSQNLEIVGKVFELEELCLLFHEGKKDYRLAEKGSRVTLDKSKRPLINASPSKALLKLTHEYDDRNIKEVKRNFLTVSGSHSPLPLTSIKSTAVPIVNVDWNGFKSKRNWKLVKLQWVDVIPFYGSLYLLREEIQNLFGNEVYIEDIVSFILCSFDIMKDRENKGELPYGLGYDFTSTNNFLDFVISTAPDYYQHLLNAAWKELPGEDIPIVLESMDQSWWKSKSLDILKFVSLSEKEAKKINLKTYSPISYLFRLESENTIFMAFNCVSLYLVNLWRRVPKGGKFHNLRGTDFEIAVNNTLTSYKYINPIWDRGKKISNVGKKKKTDLDVFVGLEDIAFPISCKAYYLSDKYLEGSGQEYYSRWEEAVVWLEEIKEIGKHLAGKWNDYKLPEGYKYIVPLVCTSSPLYVWREITDLRLPNGLPRICTLAEISDFLGNIKKYKTKLIKSNFTLNII